MSILTRNFSRRLRLALQVFKTGQIERKAMPFIWPSYRQGQITWTMNDFETYVSEGFNHNAVIYTALMYKVRAASLVRWRAYQGNPEQPELSPLDHPLAQLLDRPNPYQSQSDFIGMRLVHLNIAGNSYALIDRPPGELYPVGLYPLRPDRVFIVPNAQKQVIGYVYVPENTAPRDGIPILPQYMLHTKFPNPSDPFEGMGEGLSPFAAMAPVADVDNAITTFLNIFFKQGTMPFGSLETESALDRSTIDRLREEWDEMYGGIEFAGRPLVLDQGLKYTNLTVPFNELGFEGIDSRNEARMHGVFGVPPILTEMRLGVAGSTYANKEEARRFFWEDTMSYEIGLFTQDLDYHLKAETQFIQPDLSGVPAFKHNLAQDSTTFGGFVGNGVPINAAIKMLGLPLEPVEGGDVPLVSANLKPLEQVLNPPPPPPNPFAPPGGNPPPDQGQGGNGNNDTSEGTPNAQDAQAQRDALMLQYIQKTRELRAALTVKKK